MKRNRWAPVFGLAVLCALPGMGSAQSAVDVSHGRYETTLIIDARPMQAQVRVDGRRIGSAGELVAIAISVLPGPHTLEISAPGFHRYVGQFIAEAILLSMIGGVVGVAAGILLSRIKIVGVQPVVQPYSIALAFGVAVAVGLFFGIYPANRAASLRPIDALRYE